MKALLFGEGGGRIGAGHQVRLGALARALAASGHEPILAGRALEGSPHTWAWRGLHFRMAAADGSSAEAALEAARSTKPDAIVVDHYDVGRDVLADLAALAPLALIEDIPTARAQQARLAINAAPGVLPSDYPSSVVALGPAHALLRAEFASRPPARGPRLLAALGSAKFDRAKLLAALLDATPHEVDWIGPGMSGRRDRVRVFEHVDAATLASLMAGCRAALLSASSVCFEAASTGLPFVAVETAGNQARLAAGLAALGVPVLATSDACEARTLERALAVAADHRLKVDGRGAERVAARVAELSIAEPGLRLRDGCWRDSDLMLSWANDPSVRGASFEERIISAEEHAAWLSRKLMDPEARLFVAEDEAGPAASLRLERRERAATVSLSVVADRRGRGLGLRALEAVRHWARCARFAERLLAHVRADNPASLRLFERAGYLATGPLAVNGRPGRSFERPV